MFKHIFKHTALRAADACEEKDEQVKLLALAKTLPALPKGMPLTDLPLCRSYIIPYLPGHLLVDRDFSQQEPRIFAHFEDGPLTAAYNENPWLDLHDHASDEIFKLLGKRFPRKKTKIINLGLLYGKGIKLLASEIDDTEDVAKELKNAVLKIFPGLAEMNKTMKERARNNLPIRTWGGREYYCEPPKMVDGRMMTFDYKLINVVVQGSAADYTKEALIEYWETKEIETYFLIMVHDEFLSSTPQRMAIHAMNTMRDAMDSTTRLDVPMLSEGTVSNGNWAAMTNWDKKGVVVYDKEKDSCCIFGRSSSRM
jgi:DNA polymerase-1